MEQKGPEAAAGALVGGEGGRSAQHPHPRLATVAQLGSHLPWAPSSTARGLPAGHRSACLCWRRSGCLPPRPGSFPLSRLEVLEAETPGAGPEEGSAVTRGCEHCPLPQSLCKSL